ncbi:hypothetical protein EVAR_66183_1 [Eumeta japonica]|uniref:Uncharacterized protein n=1 Tax=Eumeta variegata TaxID=151549 RepID=A0A4C1ZMQ8_EUMVA|nr:hypothetical protein EVAR_66183_1 [Eumeta japonica]
MFEIQAQVRWLVAQCTVLQPPPLSDGYRTRRVQFSVYQVRFGHTRARTVNDLTNGFRGLNFLSFEMVERKRAKYKRVPSLQGLNYIRYCLATATSSSVFGFFNLVAGDGLDRIYLFSSDRETLKRNSGKRMGKKKEHTTGQAAWAHSLRAHSLPFSVLVQCLDHRLDKHTEITIGTRC